MSLGRVGLKLGAGLRRPLFHSLIRSCTLSNEKVAQKQAEALEGNAIIGMADACKALAPGEKLTLVGVGAFTNIALFVSVFPELLLEKVSRIVLMGGAEGRGNKVSPTLISAKQRKL